MRRPPTILAVLACLLLGALARLQASTSVEQDLAGLCDSADWIADFEILDKECVDRGDGRIETRYTLATRLPMKGAMSSVQEVRMPGGAVGARGVVVPGLPRFEVGDRAVLFLSAAGPDQWRVPVGLHAGAFQVHVGARGEAQVVPAASRCSETGCDHAGPASRPQSYDDFIQRIQRELRD